MSFLNKLNKYMKLRQLFLVAACVVVFFVAYSLVLPAITMERKTYCGKKEHEHTEECYTITRKNACGQEESEGHEHTDQCYEVKEVLACGQKEDENHTHTEECYETEKILSCGKQEVQGHTHDDSCFEEEKKLTCGMEEHVHTDECFVDPDAENTGETKKDDEKKSVSEEESEDSEESKDTPGENGVTEETKEEDKKDSSQDESSDEPEESVSETREESTDKETQGETETETETETDETTESMENDSELSYPEMVLHEKIKEKLFDTWIDVEADVPEGTLPEGTRLIIEKYVPEEKDQAEFDEELDNALYGGLLEYKAFTIRFEDAEGEPVVPLKAVPVFIKDDLIKDAENAELVLIDDEKKDDLKTFTIELDEEENAETDEDVVTFQLYPADPAVLVAASTTLEKTLTAEGKDYAITVDCSAKAGIPEGSTLKVKEILQTASDYQGYISDAEKTLNIDEGNVTYARFFDITIADKDGKEIQPKEAVDVKINLDDLQDNVPEEETPQVVHFSEEEENQEVTSEQNGDEVSFEAEGFSVYGVVYTVDFHYQVDGETYELSIPGGGFISLEHLVEMLGIGKKNGSSAIEPEENVFFSEDDTDDAEDIGGAAAVNAVEINSESVSDWTKKFVAEVDSVSFSDNTLMWTGKVNADTMIGALKTVNKLECEYSEELTNEQIAEIDSQQITAGDWALISLKPFESEETLTVMMKDGEEFTIRVTDAQISTNVLTADGKTYTITVAFNDDVEIPVGTKLSAREIEYGSDEFNQYLGRTWNELNKEYFEAEKQKEDYEEGNGEIPDIQMLNVNAARFFELTLTNAEEIIDIGKPASIEISYTEGPDLTETIKPGVVCFEEDNTEVIENAKTNTEGEKAESFSFKTESLPIVGTYIGQETKELEMKPGKSKAFSSKYQTLDASMIPVPKSNTREAEKDYTEDKNTELDHPTGEKTLDYNEDGTYTLSLSVKGQSKPSAVQKNKANVLFVMDRSSSMITNTINDATSWWYYGRWNTNDYTFRADIGGDSNRYKFYGEVPGVTRNSVSVEINGEQKTLVPLNVSNTWASWYDYNLTYVDNYGITRNYPVNSPLYVKSKTTRLVGEQTVLNGLVDSLLAQNTSAVPDNAEVAIISFGDHRFDSKSWSSETEEDWTGGNNANALHSTINSPRFTSGTNWEEALQYALAVMNAKKAKDGDNEDYYIVFLTDGEPTNVQGDTSAAAHTGSSGNLFSYDRAKDEARTMVLEKGYKFYNIFTYRNPDKETDLYSRYLTNYAYTGIDYDDNGESDACKNYYTDARTTEDLEAALSTIFEKIEAVIGHGNVSITDTLTTDAMTTSIVHGETNGYQYTVKDPNGAVLYTVTAEGDLDNPTVTFHVPDPEGGDDLDYPADESEINGKKYYSMTSPEGEKYSIALADVDSTTGELVWDLSPVGTLMNDCTYTVSFTVWPDQDAYDYVAALNNGLKTITNSKGETVDVKWNEQTAYQAEGKTYYQGGVAKYPSIVKYPDGKYAVLTNTDQKIHYSVIRTETINGVTQQPTVDGPFYRELETPEPMPLTASGSRVSKLWNINRDPDALLRLLYEFDGDLPRVVDGNPVPKKYTYPMIDEETGKPVIDEETGKPKMKTSDGFFIDFKILQDTKDPTKPAYKTVRLGWDEERHEYVWFNGTSEDAEGNSAFIKEKKYQVGGKEVTLTYGTKWEQDFSIATGLMVTEDRLEELKLNPSKYSSGTYTDDEGVETTYYLLETGHDYTLSEPELGYEFDFKAPTYHPMLVNGVMKSVLFKKNADKTITISKIEDMKIGFGSASLLEVINTLRGYLHVNKKVIGKDGKTAPDDETKFTYHITLENTNGAFTTEGSHIPWYGINELFYHTVVKNEDNEDEYLYYQAQALGTETGSNGEVIGILTLKDEDGNVHRATCAGAFNENTVGPTTVTFADSGKQIQLYGNQMDYTDPIDGEEDAYKIVSATYMITQKQRLNIANVPVSTTYTITEDEERGYQFVSIDPVPSTEINGTEIEGTIVPDSDTDIVYTNKAVSGDLKLKKLVRVNEFDPQGGKVSNTDKTKADGTYTITVAGNAGTDIADKSYEVKISVDNTGNSTHYELVSFTPSENNGTESVSANLLSDGSVILKNLPIGEYTVTETKPDGKVECIGIYCSDYSVSPNIVDRTVGVEVKPGELGDNAKLVQYTNNYHSSGDDIAHVSVRKTFEGLDPNKIPKDFKVNVQVTAKIDGVTKTFNYVLKGSDDQPDGVVFNSAVVDGNVVWNWRIAIAGLKPDAVLNVVEEGYSRTGYDVTPSVNGHYGTEFNGTVSAETVVKDFIVDDIYEPNNRKIFPVSDSGDLSKIFIARLTSDKTSLVISKNRLTLSEKKKIEEKLKKMKEGGDWTHHGNDVLYFNFEEAASNQIHVKGADITYSDDNGGQIKFEEKCQWTMVGLCTIIYQPGRPADVNFVNSYTENAVSIDIFKTEKGNPGKKLPSAVFTLKQIDAVATDNGTLTYVEGSEKTSPKTNAEGKTVFNGLTHGYYELTETTMPKGYIQTEDLVIYFKVDDGTVTYLTKEDGEPPSSWPPAVSNDSVAFAHAEEAAEDDPETEENESHPASNAAFTVGNIPGTQLPHTGGPGTRFFLIFGTVLALAAGSLLLVRFRRNQ